MTGIVPYCALIPRETYRIQYHDVSNPTSVNDPRSPAAKINSGKAIGEFVKLTIDFDLNEPVNWPEREHHNPNH